MAGIGSIFMMTYLTFLPSVLPFSKVVTSSNVGGWKLALLNGGLNYQIEHHLFPRMNHMHYATIAPVVRQFCEEKGIPYKHFPTVRENAM